MQNFSPRWYGRHGPQDNGLIHDAGIFFLYLICQNVICAEHMPTSVGFQFFFFHNYISRSFRTNVMILKNTNTACCFCWCRATLSVLHNKVSSLGKPICNGWNPAVWASMSQSLMARPWGSQNTSSPSLPELFLSVFLKRCAPCMGPYCKHLFSEHALERAGEIQKVLKPHWKTHSQDEIAGK